MELESVHLAVLIFTAVVIGYSDHLAYSYFRGTRNLLEQKVIHRLHRFVWVGLILMIGSGIALFVPMATYLLGEPAFYVKMSFVLTLVFNAWFIGKVSVVATERSFATLTTDEQKTLFLSGMISAISWIGAAVIGFLLL